MADEVVLISIKFDFKQPAQSINEVESRIRTLTASLKAIPNEGTKAFDEFANKISKEFGGSIDEAKNDIREFQRNATTEIQKGKQAVTEFNAELKKVPATANSINELEREFKQLSKEVKNLDVNTQEFAQKSAQLNQVRERLRGLKQEAGVLGKSLTQLSAEFSKQFQGLSRTIKTFVGFANIRAGVGTVRRELTQLIEKYKDSNSAAKEVDKGLSELRQSIDSAALSFLEANKGAITGFINFLNSAIPVLRENAGLILKVAAALAIYINRQQITRGVTIASQAATLAYNAALSLLALTTKKAEGATKGFSAALRANPIGLLITLIGGLIIAFTELFNRNEAFREAITSIGNAISDFIFKNEALQSAFAAIGEIVEFVGKIIGGLATVIAGVIVGIVDFVRESGLLKFILDAVGAAFGLIAKAIQNNIQFYKSIQVAVSEYIQSNSALKSSLDFVTSAFAAISELLSNLPALFAGVRAAAVQTGTIIGNFFKKLLIDFKILGQQIEANNPFSSVSSEQIEASIAELRRQRDEIDKESISVAEAFKKGYNDSIEAQKQFAEEQKRLQAESAKANAAIFEALKKRAQASASFSEAQRDAFLKEIQATKELSAAQRQELENLVRSLAQEASKINKTLVEQLQERKGKIEATIKDLILTGRSYQKQLQQLEKVTAQLTKVEEEFAAATRFTETELQRLERTQKELTDKLREAISVGADYSSEQEELEQTTRRLNEVQKEFDAIIKAINDSLIEYTQGSLADFDRQLSELSDKQKNLNIFSEEYLEVSRQIAAIEKEKAFVTELLKTETEDFTRAQLELNNALLDSQASEAAIAEALDRIRQVTDASEAGAKEIEQIQFELQQKLRAIELERIKQRRNDIEVELQALQEAKDAELAKVGENEQLKLAVQQKFAALQRELLLESSDLNTQLLNAELEEYRRVQEQKTQISKDQESKRREELEKGLEIFSQFASKTIEIVAQSEQQEFAKLKESLKESENAALQRAQQVGASEAAVQRIREDFAKKQAALERKQAQSQKAIALTQALIEQSLLIIRALATPPAPNFVAAGIATGLGLLQIGLIASRKFELGSIFDLQVQSGRRFGKGSYLKNGLYHTQGGMPIINPITGQKVAEIEKGEGIINKRTMASNDRLSLSGTPYEIASALNSYKGYGVAFPKKYAGGGTLRIAKKGGIGANYGVGGRYGISQKVVKLQSGAVFSSDIALAARKFEENSQQSKLLEAVVGQLELLNATTKTGFEETPTVSDELVKLDKLRRDELAAS